MGKKRITNIGIDLGAWNNAFTATIDLYNKKTRDALIEQNYLQLSVLVAILIN